MYKHCVLLILLHQFSIFYFSILLATTLRMQFNSEKKAFYSSFLFFPEYFTCTKKTQLFLKCMLVKVQSSVVSAPSAVTGCFCCLYI